ncbi:cyclic nucleotide-binding domain-containing protein [Paraliomyxa miuraensis]|uniref:cyclic nucleotide-binding domain-containing protein n=1 Tax=Paraliomyxa miuraensis TaxID=376150 RepID=UPI00225363E8|nr:cyclic nucleotide-binding domain-containing protein [Paraliomyxa miuraensis]MCX4242992.1 cyclic nucleotide-binding domain-containing protein [Paraliomyxa miuraensis]
MESRQKARDQAPTVEELRSIPAFRAFDHDPLAQLAQRSQVVALEEGELLMVEGDMGDEFYFLLDGGLVIHRHNDEAEREFEIATIEAGEPIGEMRLFEAAPRSASVRAACPSTVLRITVLDFEGLAETNPVFHRVEIELARRIVSRMRALGELTTATLGRERIAFRLRARASMLLINIVTILCVFAFTMNALKELRQEWPAEFLVTTIILLPITAALLVQLRVSRMPLSTVGVTTENWRKALRESVTFGLSFAVLLVLFKGSFMLFHPAYANTPMFDIFGPLQHRTLYGGSHWLTWSVDLLVYVIECPLQEFVARGVLQSTLERLLTVRYRTAVAIALSSVIFGTMHLFAEPMDALAVTVPGIGFGWLFSRHGTLVGVTIAHIIIGVTTFFLIGGMQTY